jgi:hypothetical protein
MSQPIQLLGPSPTPVQWIIHVPPEAPPNMIIIELRTCTGPQAYFLDAESALKFGQQVLDHARIAGGGLIVPPPGTRIVEPPTPNGHH